MKCIPLSNRGFTLVDDDDYELASCFKWYASKDHNTSYARYKDVPNNMHISLHKFLTGYNMTDHIDGNGLNNCRNNIRETTPSENQLNRHYHRTGSFIQKLKGVTCRPKYNKFRLRMTFNGYRKSLGDYEDPISAQIVYDLVWEELNAIQKE